MKFSKALDEDHLDACEDAVKWVGDQSLRQAWATCKRADWMLWLLGMFILRRRVEAVDGWPDRKVLVTLTCDCTERSLKFVPEGEDRPRKAIKTARRWVDGQLSDRSQSAAARSTAAYAAAAARSTAAAAAAAAATAYTNAAAAAAATAYAAAADAAYAAANAYAAYAAYAAAAHAAYAAYADAAYAAADAAAATAYAAAADAARKEEELQVMADHIRTIVPASALPREITLKMLEARS